MKKFMYFMQIAYSPNNAFITVSCRLRGGCERLPTTKVQHSRAAFLYHAVEHLRQPCLHIGQFFRGRSHGFREHPCQRLGACVTISNNDLSPQTACPPDQLGKAGGLAAETASQPDRQDRGSRNLLPIASCHPMISFRFAHSAPI